MKTRERKARTSKRKATSILIKPADPFDLIRWLARSQSDPRKAVAELVQNSLDAGARTVTIERRRLRGRPCLTIRDDGEGVLPDRERTQALEYLATHIGHSHKMGLDAAARMEKVVAGKYGVGLLGFWSIGRFFEVRSRVAGSPVHVLCLEEDAPRATLEVAPLHTDDPPTFTEIRVLDVHPTAQRTLTGRRLADYLAAELRGQLMRRSIEMTIFDHLSRGTAQKRFAVVPRQIMGERIDLPPEIPAQGHASVAVELYVARGSERLPIQVGCAGTLVAEDIADLLHLGLDADPWASGALTGIIDFPDFTVPPGTRRGVVPDEAAEAFVAALQGIQPAVMAKVAELERERGRFSARDVVRELRRALKGFRQRLPRYDLPAVKGPDHEGKPDELQDGEALPKELPEELPEEEDSRQAPMFPPGPMVTVRVVPAVVDVAPGRQRRVTATVSDADGRRIRDVELLWTLLDDRRAAFELEPAGTRPAIVARPDAILGVQATLHVEARQGERTQSASALVRVAEAESETSLGIPEPVLVHDPDRMWRSRMRGEVWEVNEGHEDYLALAGEARTRVRYLLALLMQEIVLRTSGAPEAADVLDSAVEILAHAERNLGGR